MPAPTLLSPTHGQFVAAGMGAGTRPLVLSIPGWTALSVVPLPFLLTPGKWTLPPWTLGVHTDGHMI